MSKCDCCGAESRFTVVLDEKILCYNCYRDYDFEEDASWEDGEEEEDE